MNKLRISVVTLCASLTTTASLVASVTVDAPQLGEVTTGFPRTPKGDVSSYCGWPLFGVGSDVWQDRHEWRPPGKYTT